MGTDWVTQESARACYVHGFDVAENARRDPEWHFELGPHPMQRARLACLHRP
jgi:hypothetical protein